MFKISEPTLKLAVATIKDGMERAKALLDKGEYQEATQLLAAQCLIASSIVGGDPYTVAERAGNCLIQEVETMMAVMTRPSSPLDSIMEKLGLPEDVREQVRQNASRMGISLEDAERGRCACDICRAEAANVQTVGKAHDIAEEEK